MLLTRSRICVPPVHITVDIFDVTAGGNQQKQQYTTAAYNSACVCEMYTSSERMAALR